MAVIAPQTDLYLIKSPLEIDEVNQLTFSNAAAQHAYFDSLPKIGADDFTYQRKDGTIRYAGNFEDLIGYNYCMYRNDAYSDKWFYAFITNMEYLNDSVTAITIKTDVWQTWQFDLDFKQVFVEREHVNDDTVGLHTVPEGLELGEYEIVDLRNSPLWETSIPYQDWMVCFVVTKYPGGLSSINGETNSIGGVFTSLKFFATKPDNVARAMINLYDNDPDTTADAIKNVYMIPTCCVNIDWSTGQLATGGNPTTTSGYALYPIYNYFESDPYQLQQPSKLSGNYTPVNKKLLTYPFSYFYLSNKVGEDVIYHYEDFPIETVSGNTARTITYKKAIVPSASLSSKLYFTKYKNYTETADYGTKMYNYGINYGKIPVCAWTTDYYTNWLTQNGVNVAVNTIGGVLSSGLGLAGSIATGNIIGAASSTLGIGTTIGHTIGQIHQAETTPPQSHGDINTGDFEYCFQRCSISFYQMSIRPEFARIIDNYFSAYGYKVNQVKLPNITGRRNWNYVKTIGCYIDGNVPQADLDEIKNMFNNGVTFWHNPSTFADYSQNNDII